MEIKEGLYPMLQNTVFTTKPSAPTLTEISSTEKSTDHIHRLQITQDIRCSTEIR